MQFSSGETDSFCKEVVFIQGFFAHEHYFVLVLIRCLNRMRPKYSLDYTNVRLLVLMHFLFLFSVRMDSVYKEVRKLFTLQNIFFNTKACIYRNIYIWSYCITFPISKLTIQLEATEFRKDFLNSVASSYIVQHSSRKQGNQGNSGKNFAQGKLREMEPGIVILREFLQG